MLRIVMFNNLVDNLKKDIILNDYIDQKILLVTISRMFESMFDKSIIFNWYIGNNNNIL